VFFRLQWSMWGQASHFGHSESFSRKVSLSKRLTASDVTHSTIPTTITWTAKRSACNDLEDRRCAAKTY
jgi:hypothetical protein